MTPETRVTFVRKPTMADVAEAAGVSPMTVSRALRNDRRIGNVALA